MDSDNVCFSISVLQTATITSNLVISLKCIGHCLFSYKLQWIFQTRAVNNQSARHRKTETQLAMLAKEREKKKEKNPTVQEKHINTFLVSGEQKMEGKIAIRKFPLELVTGAQLDFNSVLRYRFTRLRQNTGIACVGCCDPRSRRKPEQCWLNLLQE